MGKHRTFVMSNFSSENGFFGIRPDVLLLGGGLLFLLINAIVIFEVDVRPSAWLFYLDMRYWSVSFSVFLWIIALWLVSESLDITEEYPPMIRVFFGTGILLVIISALRSSLSVPGTFVAELPFWFDVAFVVAVCNVFRSLFLLYDYLYGERHVDEEAPWCWGVSGLILIGLVAWGLMSMISVQTQVQTGANVITITESLFTTCKNGLREMIQTGSGSLGLRILVLPLVVVAITFVYVTGRWLSIVYLKMRGQ